MSRSSTASTGRPRRVRTGSSSGTNRWAGWSGRPREPASPRATWWSGLYAAVILSRARRARRGTGTCAPTAGIPSGASRAVTATRPSVTAFTRSTWSRSTVLVTGAGPIGLLAALLAVQRGHQAYVLDRVTEGRKPEMVRRLGATYVPSGDVAEAAAEADIVIECTGFVQLLLEARPQQARYRIICLTGVSAVGTEAVIDPGLLNRNMVLQNSLLFGSVNPNRQHYEHAAKALAEADPGWLADLITRRVPLSDWADAYARRPGDIKTVLVFPDASV